MVVVDVHGEGREVADAAFPVGRDFVEGFRGIPEDAGEGALGAAGFPSPVRAREILLTVISRSVV